jgi:putative hemolysin
LWQIVLQLVLILVNAVFACAEIAVISINDNKLERMSASGNVKAKRLLSLTSKPAKFLATIQVGITVAGFLGSAFAAGNFSKHIVNWLVGLGVGIPKSTLDVMAVVFITLILSFLTLVLGELVPKRMAMQKAEAIGLAMSGLIFIIAKLFAPVVWLLTASTNALLRLMGIDPEADDDEVTEEEIRMMVDVGSESGTIDEQEKEFIHNIFDFDNKTAVEVMTHRTDVTLLWLEEDDDAWEKTINESRFSIYPVCGDSPDDVVGLLYAKDYFRLNDRKRDIVMEKAVREAQFVPETVSADVLFRNMKKNRLHFAVVLDEYGGVSGIITISDLLEELLGDMDDDTSSCEEPPLIEAVGDSTWQIRGNAPLEDVAKSLGITLPAEDYDTFAGMVFALLGNVPPDGSTPELEEYGLQIKVKEINEHRLEMATVCFANKQPAEA